jgi:hypothetical protein
MARCYPARVVEVLPAGWLPPRRRSGPAARLFRAWWSLQDGRGDPALADPLRLLAAADPALAGPIGRFAALGEEGRWEVVVGWSGVQAAALEAAYPDFERCVDSRFGLADAADLAVHYAALSREHRLAAARKVDDAPEWALADLAVHAAALVARLGGRAGREAYEWALADLMSRVDLIPVPVPPGSEWAGDMLLDLVGALGGVAT